MANPSWSPHSTPPERLDPRTRRRGFWPLSRGKIIVAAIVAACLGVALIGVAVVLAKESPPETTSGRFAVGEDGYVVREQPDEVFGTRDTLIAVARADYYAVTYLKFTVPPPAGFEIASMSLLLQADGDPPTSLQVRSVLTNEWTERELSYANRPGLGQVLSGAPGVAENKVITFDVSGVLPPTDSPDPVPTVFSFAVTNASDTDALTVFAGEHGAGAPALQVTFVEQGGRDTLPQEGRQGGQSATPSASVTPSGTPTPSASASVGPSASVSPGATSAPPPPPVNIPAGRTLCGVSFIPESGESYAQGLTREDNLFGGLEAFRVFYTGAPAAWPGNAGRSGRTVVVSFKYNPKDILSGSKDAFLKDWFKKAPRDRDVYWVYYHEPEDNIESGVFSAADYRAAWRRLAGLADAAGNSKLHATLVLMDYSLMPQSGRKWKDFYPGADVIDVLGWDVYNWNRTSYTPATDLVTRVAAASKAEGKPWGIAEMGSPKLTNDSTGSGRAAWLTAMANESIKNKALWITYFDVNYTKADWRLRDAAAQRAWKAFCDA